MIRQPRYNVMPARSKDFLPSYINYYVANGAVIMPMFGDDASDVAAKAVIAGLYPDRAVVQVWYRACSGVWNYITCYGFGFFLSWSRWLRADCLL